MADKILKQNKIPGCERLTRPEEIKALSKYLGNIKEVLEENTDLEDTNLEIPGKTTGQFHKVSKLPGEYEKLDTQDKISSLETERLELEDNRDTILSNYIDTLEDLRDTRLSDYKENLEDNREEPDLSDYREDLEDTREQTLSTYKENLEDTRDVELSEYVDNLEDNREQALSNYKESLEDSREPNLSNYKENLEDTREPDLSNYKENLEDTREPDLSNYKENLEDTREQSLSDYREDLEDIREQTLSDYREDLEDTREPNLNDYKESLEDSREPNLSTYKDSISDSREDVVLNSESDILDFGRNIDVEGLPDYKDTIIDDRSIPLSDYRDDLVDDRTNRLEDYRDDLYDPRNPALEDYRDDLVDGRTNELEDYRDDLVDGRTNRLEDYRDDLVDGRTNELEDYRDDLTDPRENELEDYRDDLTDPRNPALEDTVIERPDNSEEDARIDGVFPNNEWNTDGSPGYYGSFDNVIPKLVDDRENELEDTVIPIQYGPGENPRIDSEYDYIDNSIDLGEADPIIQQKAKNKFNNHRKIIERPDNSEEDARIDGVFPNNEWNTDGSPGYYGSFDNVIPKIEGINEVDSLYDAIIGLSEPDPNPRVSGEYDYIDNSTNSSFSNPEGVEGEVGKDKFESHQKVIERPDSVPSISSFFAEGNITEIEQYLEKNGGINTYAYTKELPEGSNSDPLYELLNTVSGLSNEELYNLVVQLLKDRNGGSLDIDASPEWKERMAAIESLMKTSPEKVKRIPFIEISGGMFGRGRKRPGRDARDDNKYDYIDNDLSADDDIRLEEKRIFSHTNEQYQRVPVAELPKTTKLGLEYIRFWTENITNLATDNNFVKMLDSVGVSLPWLGISGSEFKRDLLEDILWTLLLGRNILEFSLCTERDRLPGKSTAVGQILDDAMNIKNQVEGSGKASVTSVLKTSLKVLSKYLQDKPNPINRPDTGDFRNPLKYFSGKDEAYMGILKNQAHDKEQPATAFSYGNSRYEDNQEKGDVGKLRKGIDNLAKNMKQIFKGDDEIYLFSDNYLNGGGIRTTLMDLCSNKGYEGIEKVGSVENLLELLKNSDYITTPSKFGTIHVGNYGVQMLDSNAYWEVVIEPLCDKGLNGGFSYLPCFNEINVINWCTHGVMTSYNKWVPISNFELQKAKLTNKTVGLFDGEFSFPVSIEFTNEFRITVVDDQFKSWRNYFQKCMDVAVYNSEAHNEDFYKDNGIVWETVDKETGKLVINPDFTAVASKAVTAIDKSIISVSFYKNITFRIRIYVMTPQFSTIRRFDLLCVLKEFSEEYSGDIDAGGVDLNVTFSIVGENPSLTATEEGDGGSDTASDSDVGDSDEFESEQETEPEFIDTNASMDGYNIIA